MTLAKDADRRTLRALDMSELMKRRGEVEKKLEAAEAAWLEASEAQELRPS